VKLIEISEYRDEGYRPLVTYDAWRVAILNFTDELLPENLKQMQRHEKTDEVFVLLQGRCILFLGEGDQTVEKIHAVDMQPLKYYNIKKNCWHNHTLSTDAAVLIVENDDTCDANSPLIDVSPSQTEEMVQYTAQLWP
jgi:hypothetical protein